jgi:hypothetical protein
MPEEDPALPPDPALPERHINRFKRAFRTAAIVALSLFILLLIFVSHIHSQRKSVDEVEATANARQIGEALAEFDEKYGSFPNAKTAAMINDEFPSHGHDFSGKSSNAFFRQLIAAEITESEQIFYAKVKGRFIKADENINPGYALQKDHEVGFAYIPGSSSKDNPATPVVLTHIVTTSAKFDMDRLLGYGKAVVLFSDNSVRTYKIEKDGHIYDKGIDLLSPKHPVWKGKKPDIRYPE